jgi:DNA-binding beta-propeller fold protein YncE
MAFIGNRASSEICAVDAQKLVKLGCSALSTMPDGVQAVAATQEVWVTTPNDRSITVLDGRAARPWPARRPTSRVPLPGRPEGYAVDDERGRFFTNLEDRNETVAIDVRSRKVTSTWPVPCGEQGPRGLAYDQARQFVFVACTDKVLVMDGAHGGAVLSTLATGAGVDNIDYLGARETLYVAAGKAARLTAAHVDERGTLAVVATASTVAGARVVVVAGDGTAVVGDPHHGRVLLFSPGR